MKLTLVHAAVITLIAAGVSVLAAPILIARTFEPELPGPASFLDLLKPDASIDKAMLTDDVSKSAAMPPGVRSQLGGMTAQPQPTVHIGLYEVMVKGRSREEMLKLDSRQFKVQAQIMRRSAKSAAELFHIEKWIRDLKKERAMSRMRDRPDAAVVKLPIQRYRRQLEWLKAKHTTAAAQHDTAAFEELSGRIGKIEELRQLRDVKYGGRAPPVRGKRSGAKAHSDIPLEDWGKTSDQDFNKFLDRVRVRHRRTKLPKDSDAWKAEKTLLDQLRRHKSSRRTLPQENDRNEDAMEAESGS